MNNRLCSLLLIMIVGMSGCSKKKEPIHLEGFAQGTTYHITYFAKDSNVAEKNQDSPDSNAISLAIKNELNRLDTSISNYRGDSDIEKLNAQTSTDIQTTSEEIVYLIAISRAISKASKGCYDITIKPLFDLWGFKQDALKIPNNDTLQATLAQVGIDKLISLDKNHLQKTIAKLRIDLSSLGQGYSVGKIATILEQRGITQYLVEIGGELKTRGKKPDGADWRIALEKPLPNERTLEKIVAFHSGEPLSMMTSGTYRHFFDYQGKRYSHILDARTGKPVEHNTVSVTVFHPDPTLADAWSTALLCLGSDEGLKIADDNAIAALYIDQEAEKLTEIKSSALVKLSSVVFEEPKH
jgi:FAD:protein FMN transferase